MSVIQMSAEATQSLEMEKMQAGFKPTRGGKSKASLNLLLPRGLMFSWSSLAPTELLFSPPSISLIALLHVDLHVERYLFSVIPLTPIKILTPNI